MPSSYEYGQELAAQLAEAGIDVVTSPSAINPPCVLITPPTRRYDLNCGYTATFELVAVTVAPNDEDAWQALDKLIDAVADVLDVTEVNLIGWGSENLPAALITVEGIINYGD